MLTVVSHSIEEAKKYLLKGYPIGIPTETVYGLAANGLDPIAISRVFEVKKRPLFNPLIYHTSNWERMYKYVRHLEGLQKEVFGLLIEKFSPGPLTILFACKKTIPEIGRSGLPRVGVRVPEHPITLQLLDSLDFPLVAPSANIYGRLSPTSVKHVNQQLGGSIPYILDGSNCQIGIESTVVGWENEKLKVYRLGGIAIENIQSIYPNVVINNHSNSNPSSPGQMSSHYTTKQKIIVGEIGKRIIKCKEENKKFGVLSFQKGYNNVPKSYQRVLSRRGNLNEAAGNLFKYLNELQELDIETILAEFVPNINLGQAINDKLRRASYATD